MQVSVETTSELGRKLTVEIPEQRIHEAVSSRLGALAKDIKMDGFRPGKVPQHLIKRHYGLQVRDEVLSEIFQSSLQEALDQQSLKPVSQLQIDTLGMDEGKGMRYVASFEVGPAFVLMPLETLDVTRYVPEISEADVTDVVERVRQSQENWVWQERPAHSGDRLIVNFEGWVQGESVTNGMVENYPVILGGAEKIPGFDENLNGVSGNSHIEFDELFPEDYPKQNMAGRMVSFRVDVLRVEERQLPELNADWIRSLGVEDGEYQTLCNGFRAELEREMLAIAKARTKTSLMDALFAANPISVPPSLVKEEIDAAVTVARADAEKNQVAFDEEAARSVYAQPAHRRVALMLLFAHIVELYNIQLSKQKVDATLAEIASAYENSAEILEWYRKDKKSFESVQRLAHEDMVVSCLLEKARVRDVILTPRDVAPQTA